MTTEQKNKIIDIFTKAKAMREEKQDKRIVFLYVDGQMHSNELEEVLTTKTFPEFEGTPVGEMMLWLFRDLID